MEFAIDTRTWYLLEFRDIEKEENDVTLVEFSLCGMDCFAPVATCN
ncbi:MAG: hypothetical protein K5798_03310 [Nitrosopumilus sp.]|nr:hypothetical protein [Nitrosopumilus sp.]MCV0366279.1 hypothetical protein [Nitrosopumilus sp.]